MKMNTNVSSPMSERRDVSEKLEKWIEMKNNLEVCYITDNSFN